MNNFHVPVLFKESLDLLKIKKNGKYIDATLGGGGHALGIISLGGIVLGIDQDEQALNFVKDKNFNNKQNLILAKGNFIDIDKIAHLNNFENVDGIIYDLGISSYQIDTPARGFSFLKEGPLDMRMDRSSALTAEVLVNLMQKDELVNLFTKLGQETWAMAIASEIVKRRKIKAIKTTQELSKIIEEVRGYKGEVSDFKKNEIDQKVFQALRIAVNNELESITESLPKALTLLSSKGRIAVITFHSLEDGIVKKSFEKFQNDKLGKIIIEKPIIASEVETRENSRSKSAKLRVFEKN